MSDTPQTDAVMIDPMRDGNDLPNLARCLERERNKFRDQNTKLRDIAERAIEEMESGDPVGTADAYRAELDQLKEGVK